MKRLKKAFALILTGILFIGCMGNSATEQAYAAGNISMEFGLQYGAEDFADTTFNGSDVFEIPEQNIGLFRDNIKTASSLDISITFKVAAAAKDYISLLEISDKSNNSSSASSAQSSIAVIVSKSGKVFFEAGSYKSGTDWSSPGNLKNIADGQFHTLKMSVSANKMVCQIDDSAQQEVSTDSTDRKTKKFMTAFFGGTADGFTDWRDNIDSIVIGGLSPNSYFSSSNYTNLNGEISAISVSGVNNVSDITGGRVTTGMFDASIHDNTWLFGGGVETQGRFAEIGGIRNYIGQFEEYIRWTKRINSTLEGMQRYTINMGKEGQDAVMFASKLASHIERVQPRAVSYLVGPEDYSNGQSGIDDFKEALSEIIELSLTMKQNTDGNYDSYAVIQLPHAVKDEETASNIALYAKAARDVIGGIAAKDSDKADRILLVDHLAQTDNDTFKNTMLTDKGLLNADGHYEIAKQFSQAVCGSTSQFHTISDSWTAEDAPETYEDTALSVTADTDSLTVSIPEDDETTGWHYILTINGAQISGTAYGNPFTIQNLPENETYELILRTKDDSMQLPAVTGKIAKGSEAKPSEPEGEFQEKLRDLLDKRDSVTWLFMGDSITHAAAHTHGYDGIAQIFEKYVKEDLNRTDDIVINTAVSGATLDRTLQNIEQRLTKYKPDIVSVMLGTNDAIPGNYAANLKTLIEKMRESNPNALIIFRSPTPSTNRNYGAKLPGPNGSVALMKSAAEEDGNILFIDQYTQWEKERTAYPYLMGANYYYGDGSVHPGAAGQLRMFRQFVQECGLNTHTKLAELAYRFNYTEEQSTQQPDVTIADEKDAVTVSKTAVADVYDGGEIGGITVLMTDSGGRSYEKSSGLDNDGVTIDLPSEDRYTIKITANIKGSTAKHVTFAEWEIPLTIETETDDDISASQAVAGLLDEISEYDDVTEHERDIENIRMAYELLTDTQKLLVSNEKLKLLLDAENTINTQKANTVIDRISHLETIDNADEYNKEALAIQSAYEALTAEQKQLLSKADALKLTNAVNAAELAADKQKADAVIAKIKAIGTVDASAACNQKIADARAAFDALTAKQKALISEALKKELTDAETLHTKLINEKPNDKTDENPPVTVTDFDVENLHYTITDDSELTVEVTSALNKNITNISIPAFVSYGDKAYKVTSIKAAAFKNCKKATAAVIGKNVKTIGSNAFAGCGKLKKVTIKSTALKQIGGKAFSNCKALKTIIIKSKVLNKVGANAFKGIHKNAVIKVPSAKLKPYTRLLSKKGQGKNVKIKK